MEPNKMDKALKNEDIYISLDHLKNGKYNLKLLSENKVFKVIKIKKH